MTVDIVIPTYKPTAKFLALMDALLCQTLTAEKIIIINTEKSYFETLMPEETFLEKYPSSIIFHLKAAEFDHGGSRNLGVSHTTGDYFCMMTQDAVPADEHLLKRLLDGLMQSENAAVCYARQMANADSDALERFMRVYNYGEEMQEKSRTDLERLGLKTFFCSNVCALYDKAIFNELGGFINKAIFNEDMIYAAKAIGAGHVIRYEPSAVVYHAHDYGLGQQMKRNFDLGVSHAEYATYFSGLGAEAEGLKMIKAAVVYLIKQKKPGLIFKLFAQSIAKYRGFRLGRKYYLLSDEKILKYSANLNYWK